MINTKPEGWPDNIAFTGWMNTDAIAVECPRCEADIGATCRTPKGRKAQETHGRRTRELILKFGASPWRRGVPS